MAGKFETPRNGAGEGQPPRRRRRKRRRRVQPLVLLIPAAVLILIVALVLTMCGKKNDGKPASGKAETTAATEQTEPELSVTARATVASMGDMLMHKYLFTADPKYPSACNLGDGKYDFDSIFRYVKDTISGADYAVANLETTFGGDGYPYQGNPNFNCPDALADALANAGFDMLLTANNHCADTTVEGLKRTLEQVRSRGLATLGTQLNDDEKKYTVVDVNGIKIGMLCYTYAAGLESDGSPNLNFKEQTIVRETGVVNYFTVNALEKLYSEVQTHLANMRADGAEAILLYIHWGTEYLLTEDANQRAIAQKMCDLGVDVIVGGHPHVVEPMDLLTSTTDPEHRTVCIYSLGNAVSNQRREEMASRPEGHTEDGALFTVTFEKYSDGTVRVAEANVMPTWVNKFVNGDGKVEYNILPLDKDSQDQWQSRFSLNDTQYNSLLESYNRTMNIVGSGLTKCQTYLDQTGLSQTGESVGAAA